MDLSNIIDRIDAVSIPPQAAITQLQHEEDDGSYRVWRIDTENRSYILKEAKGQEGELYRSILTTIPESVPTLYQIITTDNKTYLLMEYIEGEDLCKCDRKKLTLALDALISMQRKTWGLQQPTEQSEKSFLQRQTRGKYLNDHLLEKAYENFLTVYQTVPQALCHDDLLPFNVIVTAQKAVLIDWEVGGILPYPTSFARLIAHTQDDPSALFCMTQEDKNFAIEYYYDNLLKEKGISYDEWRRTLECFLFYEYCEWVFVGNKYNATDGEYYQKYLPIAQKQAVRVLQTEMR